MQAAPDSPDADEITALVAFARANGRTWKNKLREAWMNGNYRDVPGTENYPALQRVRNEFGPEWLMRFQPSKVGADLAARGADAAQASTASRPQESPREEESDDDEDEALRA